MDSNIFWSRYGDLNYDIEMAIAKALRKIQFNHIENIKIGEDKNGVRCVLYYGKPLRENNVEKNIEILEELERLV